VANLARGRLPRRKLLQRAAQMALAGFGGRRALLATLTCVGARTMIGLNARFHGRSELTDVLAFPLGETDEESRRLVPGEVVICRPAAVRQARLRGLSVEGELLLYAVHGWLHLAGWRDRSRVQRRRMARAERRILARLGFRRDRP
jgi:probable rRNA maturation factor